MDHGPFQGIRLMHPSQKFFSSPTISVGWTRLMHCTWTFRNSREGFRIEAARKRPKARRTSLSRSEARKMDLLGFGAPTSDVYLPVKKWWRTWASSVALAPQTP